MRLLIINPNTSTGVTDRIAGAAADVALSSDTFTAISAPFGAPLIANEADADIAQKAVVAAAQNHDAPVDGMVIASFGDAGIDQVRAVVDCPVVGIGHAGLLSAAARGGRFSIITFTDVVVPSMQRTVARYGVEDRLADIRVVADPGNFDAATVQDDLFDQLLDLCHGAERDGVDSLVMGGGPLAGLARRIAPLVGIPVIDGTVAAVQLQRVLNHGKPN